MLFSPEDPCGPSAKREGPIGFDQAIPMLIQSRGLEMIQCRSLDHFLCQLKNIKSRKEKSENQQVAVSS